MAKSISTDDLRKLTEVGVLPDSNQVLLDKVSSLKKKLAAANKTNDSFKKKQAAANKTNARLKKKLAAATKTNARLEKQLAASGKSNNNLVQKLVAADKTNDSFKKQLAASGKSNDSLKQKLATADKTIVDLKQKLATADKTIVDLKQKLAAAGKTSDGFKPLGLHPMLTSIQVALPSYQPCAPFGGASKVPPQVSSEKHNSSSPRQKATGAEYKGSKRSRNRLWVEVANRPSPPKRSRKQVTASGTSRSATTASGVSCSAAVGNSVPCSAADASRVPCSAAAASCTPCSENKSRETISQAGGATSALTVQIEEIVFADRLGRAMGAATKYTTRLQNYKRDAQALESRRKQVLDMMPLKEPAVCRHPELFQGMMDRFWATNFKDMVMALATPDGESTHLLSCAAQWENEHGRDPVPLEDKHLLVQYISTYVKKVFIAVAVFLRRRTSAQTKTKQLKRDLGIGRVPASKLNGVHPHRVNLACIDQSKMNERVFRAILEGIRVPSTCPTKKE